MSITTVTGPDADPGARQTRHRGGTGVGRDARPDRQKRDTTRSGPARATRTQDFFFLPMLGNRFLTAAVTFFCSAAVPF